MKQIKFRQWLSRNKHWHYFELTDGNCQGVVSASLLENPIMQFTGILDKNNNEIYGDDEITFELGFQSGDFTGNYQGIQGFHSQDGFFGTIEWDDKLAQWMINKIKYPRAIEDSDYVFKMNQQYWTQDELNHYCNIKSKPLYKAKKIIITGNKFQS